MAPLCLARVWWLVRVIPPSFFVVFGVLVSGLVYVVLPPVHSGGIYRFGYLRTLVGGLGLLARKSSQVPVGKAFGSKDHGLRFLTIFLEVEGPPPYTDLYTGFVLFSHL